jgi:uncharacterized protein (DUF3084 family)
VPSTALAPVQEQKRAMESEYEKAARELAEIGQELGGYD